MSVPGGPPPARPVSITACPDGPLLVRGDATILDADGQPVPRRRATVALCRCGGTAIAPYCDGTHKVNGFRTMEADGGDTDGAGDASPVGSDGSAPAG